MDNLIKVWNWNLVKDEGDNAWVTGAELGTHLGYEEPMESVGKLYKRHQESFIEEKDSLGG